MGSQFYYHGCLSQSAKDMAVVQPLAERLRQEGLTVWFDEWVLKPGDCMPAKIDRTPLENYRGTMKGLGRSHILPCPAEASERRRKSGTCPFCGSLNHERRFIPAFQPSAFSLRPFLDGSLAQFLYINWCPTGRNIRNTE